MSNKSNGLQRAIAYFGSQSKLAKRIGVGQQHISYWLRHSKVPAEYCAAIEKATKRKVKRGDLRPDLWGSRS